MPAYNSCAVQQVLCWQCWQAAHLESLHPALLWHPELCLLGTGVICNLQSLCTQLSSSLRLLLQSSFLLVSSWLERGIIVVLTSMILTHASSRTLRWKPPQLLGLKMFRLSINVETVYNEKALVGSFFKYCACAYLHCAAVC